MNIPIKYLIFACFILLLFSISYLIVFNAYGQQGGAATGGSATSGSTIGGAVPCYGSNCNYYIYGPPAIGGPATGGNAISSGNQGGQFQLNNNLNNNYNRPPSTGANAIGSGSGVVQGGQSQLNNNYNPSTNIENIESLIKSGMLDIADGKFDEAITYFDRALAINPNDRSALIFKGAALNNLHKYNEAITYFDRYLAIDPNDVLAHYEKNIAIKKLKKHDNG